MVVVGAGVVEVVVEVVRGNVVVVVLELLVIVVTTLEVTNFVVVEVSKN